MRFQIILTAILFLSLAFGGYAQELSETADAESHKNAATRLLDEFGVFGDCELSARVHGLFMTLAETAGSKGYIIIYRGADALPAKQRRSAYDRQVRRIYLQTAFLKLDPSRLVMIDGGFRPASSVWHEVWVVPENGTIPQPTGTVEKSKIPAGQAFKVDEGSLDNFAALLKQEPEVSGEPEQPDEETAETPEETLESAEIENLPEQVPERVSEMDQAEEDEFAPYYWVSTEFAESLREQRDARGLVIFYADAAEYDIDASRRILEAGLQNLAEKSKVDLSAVKIIFGGYRDETGVEYWIVPPGAAEPRPTPARKIVEEVENQ